MASTFFKRFLWLCAPFVFLVAYFITGSTAGYLVGQSGDGDYVLATIIVDLVFAVLAILYARWFKAHGGMFWLEVPRPGAIEPHDRKFTWKGLLVFLLVFAVLWLAGQCCGVGVIHLGIDETSYSSYTSSLQADPTLAILFVVIVAPIAEEFIFRGCVYDSIRVVMHPIAAMFFSCALFAMIHGTLVQWPAAFFTGIGFTLAFELTGNVKWSMIVHAVGNFLTSFLGTSWVPDFLADTPVMLIIGILATVFVCFWLTVPGLGTDDIVKEEEVVESD